MLKRKSTSEREYKVHRFNSNQLLESLPSLGLKKICFFGLHGGRHQTFQISVLDFVKMTQLALLSMVQEHIFSSRLQMAPDNVTEWLSFKCEALITFVLRKKINYHFFFMFRGDVSDVVPPGDHFCVSGVAEDGVERFDELSSVVFGELRRHRRRHQQKNGEKADQLHFENFASHAWNKG